MWFNEFSDLQGTVKHVAKSATRALGAVISKFKRTGGILFDCYKQLLDSMVKPVLLYCAGIWGTENRQVINTVQPKACPFSLEYKKLLVCNIATRGEMGWISIYTCQILEVIRLVCRLCNLPATRLTKHVFQWSFVWHKIELKIGSIDRSQYSTMEK